MRYSHAQNGCRAPGEDASPLLATLHRLASDFVHSRPLKYTLVLCLIFALFGGGIWQLLDVPDDPGNVVLDAMMIVVTVIFVFEIAINCFVDQRLYLTSFFFWADVLGTVSMVFEISYLLGNHGSMINPDSEHTFVLLRTARTAKVGFRAGRFVKIAKCLPLINTIGVFRVLKLGGNEKTTSAFFTRLMFTLSTRVSIMTVVLAVVPPLFTLGNYPTEDRSLQAWVDRLEVDYGRAFEAVSAAGGGTTSIFLDTVVEMQDFYADLPYYPYRIRGFTENVLISGEAGIILGESLLQNADPVRAQNIFKVDTDFCRVDRPGCTGSERASLYLDFQSPMQLEAGMEFVTTVFIIGMMLLISCDLSRTLSVLVIQPLEKMFTVVREMRGEEEEDEDAPHTETEQLEVLFSRLVRIRQIESCRSAVSQKEYAKMDNESRGVLMDVMQLQIKTPGQHHSQRVSGRRWSVQSADDDVVALEELVVLTLPEKVPAKAVPTWNINFLALDGEDQKKLALHIIFDTPMGFSTFRDLVDVGTMRTFLNRVEAGYGANPYHNFAHACDVFHSVYRILCETMSGEWLSDAEQFAILVSALGHDIGHFGMTNPFLVESRHMLALCYNDKSPLENMHCAKLFEICSNAESNVFKSLTGDVFKMTRKVCVEAILHTDMAEHFNMVKGLDKFYEMNADVCDLQASVPHLLRDNYANQVLRKDTLTWLQVFLHLADVSNPLKPFKICHAWAWRVLEEFFQQGDEEKRLGMPVGMLNDRDRVNKPGSQHGFINFLVAPFVFSTVKLFPVLCPLSFQMAKNLEEWRNIWVEEAKPSAEDIEKKDKDVRKVKERVDELTARATHKVPSTFVGDL
mmetsp:Transcript_39876/g.105780  ORF Transcript_39876/g.105780 Transcript_39876/m.105780 type:complete len:853 (-) Transcript_39876:108-2666(-)|eukprot:CAMPEP_0194524120 /NCGR_PEP_ID=MMETSP0253-20130528/59187_1 /TAXON_ID=2966 /ORGANISM="Noctiluca scintillans" /LENGTH=852 /DNA_ID=CAMNT_0039368715 /DNA_START=52 /DNA_END=2610 /DNA_ORIENTATION=+